ncbi:hypothetical protein Pla52n_36700 [Stieleria varia]|uniref:Uncharacterized protein n=1 Tax=Stieleria varia TaxID=2528005 RepID=A0A5C6AWX4_9BACT|nr:hypothetical protein Pla52n_36700 [Stieleria varia]
MGIANVADVESGLHTTLDDLQAFKEDKNVSELGFLSTKTETLHYSVLSDRFC